MKLAAAVLLSIGVSGPAHAATSPVVPPKPVLTVEEPNALPRPTGERVVPKHLRLSTPEEKEAWEKAADSLWQTPLGQLYNEYLFSPTPDHADLPLWARLLAKRIFQQPNMLNLRVAALQIMLEDLYVREKMTPDASDRVMILNAHIAQKDRLFDQQLRYKAAYVVMPVVLAAMPFGSRIFRQEASKVVEAGYRRIRGRPIRAGRRPKLSRFFTDEDDKFAIPQAANAVGISLWMLEGSIYLYNDWLYGSMWAPKDQVMLLGLDSLVRAMEDPGDIHVPRRGLTHR